MRGKSERARAIVVSRHGRRISMKYGTGRRFYHRYRGNSLAPQGFAAQVGGKPTARREGRAVT
jgi:hypothetical protein